jgi:2-octaprenyl-6-methoxyphenol hydroxylase
LNTDYDILIAGGGMVGASLARAVAGLGLKIAVLEPVRAEAAVQPSYDDRVIALAYGSRLILDAMGVWKPLAANAQPIERIHISDRGHFGFAHLDCREESTPALGYVLTARAIGASLLADIETQAGLDWLSPANLLSFQTMTDHVLANIEVDGQIRQLSARLLVGADGGDSAVRRQLDPPLRQWTYGQTAVIANISPSKPHGNVAYERFTDSGPLALLPMSEHRCSLVWTQRDADVDELLGLDDAAFLQRLQRRFGFRLGRFHRLGRRAAYPLRFTQVKKMFAPRVLLIGNAAHSLHPIAGQGFNLGLRDVAQFADSLAQAAAQGEDPGATAVLQAYAAARMPDQQGVGLMTDGLARLFSNPLPPLRLARNAGLLALDMLPPLKRRLARQFMGLQGRLPRLSRGLPLV